MNRTCIQSTVSFVYRWLNSKHLQMFNYENNTDQYWTKIDKYLHQSFYPSAERDDEYILFSLPSHTEKAVSITFISFIINCTQFF